MAINKQIRENLPEEALVFDNASYDNSIIGISTDGRVVYSFEKMIKEFMSDENVSEMEAIEWIEYNTIRALSYMGDNAPIICEEILI